MPWLAGAAILLTAFTLRPAVTSLGALLRDVQAATGMSSTVAGVLTTLPPVCFGVFGLLGGRLGRRHKVEHVLVWAGVATALGLAVRVATGMPWVLLLFTIPALGGMAVGNVLLPVAVRAWFPRQTGRVTGLYALVMAIGTAIPAAASVPVARAAGSWQFGLGIWAVPSALAAIPWLLLRQRARVRARTEIVEAPEPSNDVSTPPHVPMLRRGRAWALAAFFGLQSMAAYVVMGWLPTIYRDAGVDAGRAGVLLALVTLLSGVMSITLPEFAARRDDQRPLVLIVAASAGCGYLGLLLAPAAAPFAWAVLIGVGMGAFPLALVLIGLRSRTDQGTAELSSLAQGAGYLIAASGPVTVGALYEATGSWDIPLVLLLGLLVPMAAAGFAAARPGAFDAVR